ncbi:50S ribosomal protein L25, partial [Candidatus Gribaldobacteria bacterium]|nr:50S ribosomal protein L25 [Candidatus Gribaldobacteria bacterium]
MNNLKATIRKKGENLGQARKGGLIPAVLYGEGLKNINLFVSEKPFLNLFQQIGETSTFNLEVEDKKYQALIRQIDKNPLNEKIIHLDFFHPSLKKKITADAPLVFKGESVAVKDLGGILEKELTFLKVKGLVKDIPRAIEVDISNLKNLEDKIIISDLSIPSGITIEHHQIDDIVVHIT